MIPPETIELETTERYNAQVLTVLHRTETLLTLMMMI